MQLTQGAIIDGRYRLDRPLSKGGMGAVWHATQLALDVQCALKFIEGAQADLPEMRSRFELEAKAAAALKSPHVVQVMDYGIFEGTPWMAMELLQGEDLAARLSRHHILPPAEVYSILNQVCRALTKAHALGIVHRDLKPGNIFIVRDDDREIVKVLDFGIAKQQLGGDLGGNNTRTGAMLGTPRYMSPEQAQGTKAVDHRSDLWSLAVIAYVSLTGQMPFRSEALGDLLMKIIVGELPVPSQVAPVPSGFDEWWRKAASRDPAGRFQTAREFADALGVACQVSQLSLSGDASGLGMTNLHPPAAPGLTPAAPVHPGVPPVMTDGFGATPSPMANTFGPQLAAEKRPKTALLVSLGVAAGLTVFVGIFFAVTRTTSDSSVSPAVDPAPVVATVLPAPPPAVTTAVAPAAPPPPASAAVAATSEPVVPSAVTHAAAVPTTVATSTTRQIASKPSAKSAPARPADLGF